MHTKFLFITLLGLSMFGCASHRASDQEVLRPGVCYTTSLGGGLIAEIKRHKNTDTLDIFIMRQREIIAQFGASDHQTSSQHTLNVEHGDRTLTVDVKDGKLVTHTFSYDDGQIFQMILDRDGDSYPDERWTFDKTTQKRTREKITHDFTPIEDKK